MIDTEELPVGWLLSQLKEIVLNIQYGYTASSSELRVGPKFLRITDLQNNSVNWDSVPFCECENPEKYLLESGDIVIARTGATTGKSFLLKELPETTVFASYLIRLSTSALFPPDYLSWFMQSPYYWTQITKVSKGSAQPGANAKILSQLQLPLPPLNEQHRIVTKIETLTARSRKAREALDAIPALLDQFRQSVLAAAFRGDLTADWREENPDVESGEELLESLLKSRESEYGVQKESLQSNNSRVPKLPPVEESLEMKSKAPVTWLSVTLESASIFIIDCLHSTPKFVEKGEYCIDTTCIEPFSIDWESARKVTQEDFKKRTSRLLPTSGDIVFSREGTIGTAAMVPEDKQLCLGQRMMMFRFSSLILPQYAEMYLQSPHFKFQYEPLITGTTSPHVNIGELRKLSFLIPSLKEQVEIVKKTRAYLNACERISLFQSKNETELSQLDQSILAKAFRGKLVSQDPNDEPATVLLQRIQAEREKLKSKSKRKTRAKKK